MLLRAKQFVQGSDQFLSNDGRPEFIMQSEQKGEDLDMDNKKGVQHYNVDDNKNTTISIDEHKQQL